MGSHSIIQSLTECWEPVNGIAGYSIKNYGDITLLHNSVRGFAWCEADARYAPLIQEEFPQLPLFFYVNSANESLIRRFQGSAYQVYEMVFDLKNLGDVSHDPSLEVQELANGHEKAIHLWSTIIAEGNSDTQRQVWDFISPLIGNKRYIFFIGYWRGLPVSTSMILLGKKDAALFFVHTKEAYRKRGVGEAVSRAALKKAYASGFSDVVLSSTGIAEPLYRKIGFKLQRLFLEYYVSPLEAAVS